MFILVLTLSSLVAAATAKPSGGYWPYLGHAGHEHAHLSLADNPIVVPDYVPNRVVVAGPVQESTLVQGPQQGSTLVQGPRQGSATIIGPSQGSASIIGPQDSGALVIGPSADGPARIITGGASIIGPQTQGASIIGPRDGGATIIGPQSAGVSIVGSQGAGPSYVVDHIEDAHAHAHADAHAHAHADAHAHDVLIHQPPVYIKEVIREPTIVHQHHPHVYDVHSHRVICAPPADGVSTSAAVNAIAHAGSRYGPVHVGSALGRPVVTLSGPPVVGFARPLSINGPYVTGLSSSSSSSSASSYAHSSSSSDYSGAKKFWYPGPVSVKC